MGNACDRCGRGPLKGNLKSHSNIKTIHRQKLNLQVKRVDGKKMTICANCIRTLTKVKQR
ncbi:MAG: 50S ribosomal protein L28 [Candidatus Buchananbacteria bacterium CG10_big_fil_rev_8_21_14_0_10_42_9]|uniref:50S ribosomal protein L28 n=1 Tax=Candidatus Buchananbacteria bacterium CG10_big_fil_rev_8_21_14_0_10_42_9 TaxID=1974526 RepID=A0A2H0W230_9BACT|nr:MAG: 50S ribosomal protein L28 [Candidatus Buchananbacteria bacterium CG10_big_fil_rev_8_21_14_0_10_42_9]